MVTDIRLNSGDYRIGKVQASWYQLGIRHAQVFRLLAPCSLYDPIRGLLGISVISEHFDKQRERSSSKVNLFGQSVFFKYVFDVALKPPALPGDTNQQRSTGRFAPKPVSPAHD